MRPATLGIPGEEHLTTSTEFLELDELPRRIVFVVGYISFEFAHVAARAGAQVEVLDRGTRPLKGFDPDLVDQLVQGTRELGITVRLQNTVHAVERHGDHFVVRCATPDAGEYTCEGDLVVHGAGRVAEIDDLNLSAAGIQYEPRGVVVNQFLQSVSNPPVYAAGDSAATEGLPLMPVAALEGEVAGDNLVQGNHRTPNYAGVPTVVFSVPPLTSVGLHEGAARERGLEFRTHFEDTSEWQSSRRVGLTHAGTKVLIEEGNGRILGAHMLGPHADEIINIFALTIREGLTAADLEEMPYSYPTSASHIWYMV